MQLFKLTDDPIVKRLRWVMIGMIIFGMINTLSGQPGSYWIHPETAIRGDGLSIYNETNRTFEFFLGMGWLTYLIAKTVFILGVFWAVSIIPKRPALIIIFSIIIGNYFDLTNWLAVRWHLFGLSGLAISSFVLGMVIVFTAFPILSQSTIQGIKALRWLMLIVIAIDVFNTLLGQPTGFWLHPETVNEANPVAHFFLIHGWYAFVIYNIIYSLGIILLISSLSRRWALICTFCFIFAHFIASSTWLFYRWRLGFETPVIYGAVLSVIIVQLVFFNREKTRDGDFLSTELTADDKNDLCPGKFEFIKCV
ncbi:MAG: hypothetical protein WCA84_09825 [Ignavibacteriaceae bacterium]